MQMEFFGIIEEKNKCSPKKKIEKKYSTVHNVFFSQWKEIIFVGFITCFFFPPFINFNGDQAV